MSNIRMKYLILLSLFVSSTAFANEGLDRVVEQHRIESEQRLSEFQKLKRESEAKLREQEQKVLSIDTSFTTGAVPSRAVVRARINTLKSNLGIYGRF